jgi:hypothetical protein
MFKTLLGLIVGFAIGISFSHPVKAQNQSDHFQRWTIIYDGAIAPITRHYLIPADVPVLDIRGSVASHVTKYDAATMVETVQSPTPRQNGLPQASPEKFLRLR